MPGYGGPNGPDGKGGTAGKKGGQGSGGWGGGGTQPRDPAGPGGAISGGPGAGPGAKTGGGPGKPANGAALPGIKGVIGGLLGYDTYGDLRTAFNRNPNVRSRGSVTVPNIPNASWGQILGNGLLGAMMPGIGSALTVGGNIATGFGSDIGPYGFSADMFDRVLGDKPGKIEGNTDAGRLNDQGDPGGGLLGLYKPVPTPAAPPTATAAAAAPQPQQVSPLNFANNPSLFQPIGGPSQYGVTLPSWNYQYR